MKSLQAIAEYYTRLRIAGMSDEEIEIFKKSVSMTAIINRIDVIKLTEDCVIRYEEIRERESNAVESKMIKADLRMRGIIE